MSTISRPRCLHLPDILPCPGGRCAVHTQLFGTPDQPPPENWSCQRCGKTHPTTLEPNAAAQFTPGKSQLESLPAEILEEIGSYLAWDKAVLVLTSRTICQKIGTGALKAVVKDYLIYQLGRDIPAYAPCPDCKVLRPFDSAEAWPLLRRRNEAGKIPRSFHAVSSFLAQKVKAFQESEGNSGACPSMLACAGTYLKPWASQDVHRLRDTGFDIQNGLTIAYRATSRRGGVMFPKMPLASHVEYLIELPSSFSSFSTANRFAILRDFYLCPHVYASKLQFRDPGDPTYPADSSISHWLPNPIPESRVSCYLCTADFRAVFSSASEVEHKIKIDVWRNLNGGCNDGSTEAVYCSAPARWGAIKYGLVKQGFERGKDL